MWCKTVSISNWLITHWVKLSSKSEYVDGLPSVDSGLLLLASTNGFRANGRLGMIENSVKNWNGVLEICSPC